MTRLGESRGAINLSQGLPELETPPEVVQAASQAVLAGDNQYTFPFGLSEFREAISGKYWRDRKLALDPGSELTVTCGVSEAVISTILALTEPGDEVIIIEPCYENYVPDCWMAGVKPVFVKLEGENYSLDPEALAAAFNARTRMIILNTPHNPTGRVLSGVELQRIANLCIKFDVIAVADEIYEYITYENARHISLATIPGMKERTVTISGLGKTYAVTGWRVGWAAACPEITHRIRKVHDFLTVCAPAPFQRAGITALNLPEDYYEKIRQDYHERKNILLKALDACGLAYFPPQGAYYVMADFSPVHWDLEKYKRDGWTLDRAFAEFMAVEIGVAVVPGSSFYFESKRAGEHKIRFNFAKTVPTMERAAERLMNLKIR